MLPGVVCDRQPTVDQSQCSVVTLRHGLELGKQPMKPWRAEIIALTDIVRPRLPQLFSPSLRLIKSTARPAAKNSRQCNKEVHSVLSTQRIHRLGEAERSGDVVTPDLKKHHA
jgi:hypothetical protein